MNGVGTLCLEIGKLYQVKLSEQMYFNPWDGGREVELVPEKEKNKVSRDLFYGHNTIEEIAWYGENGILCVTEAFIGKYIGEGRLGVIRFEPAGGIQHPESRHLVVPQQYVDEIQLMRP